MGCVNSTELFSIFSSPHPLVTDKQPFLKKVKANEAIKKNDPFLVQKILEEVHPTENLGVPGQNYTGLHVAAQHNSFQAMDILLSWLKKNRSADLQAILEIPDSKGFIPVEKAIVHNGPETLHVMLSAGVIDLKDKKRDNLTGLAEEHSKDCLDVLQKYQKENGLIKDIAKLPETPIPEQKKVEAIEQRVQKAAEIAPQQEQVKQLPKNDSTALKGIPANTRVYQLINELSKKGDHFRDPQFLLVADSLTINQNHKHIAQFKNAVWKRPNELFKSDFSEILLFDTIDPHDVKQGILGVCYFLSCLSALAEFPSRLTQVFINQFTNTYGAYAVKFFVQGVPTEIVVDDYIPCYGDRQVPTPLFSKPKGKELWVLLAEKAWGKLYNNYVASEAGFTNEALEYLTGTPVAHYLTQEVSADDIFRLILDGDRKNYVICASTSGTANKEVGLVANHAYSVISAHQVGDYRILKLRNPWGNLEWNGDFSDNSDLWTEEIKAAVGYTNADDGMFCMTPEDLKKWFASFSICVYNEGWEYNYIESESEPNHAEYFSFSVNQPCDVYFRIHQEDKRFYDKTGREYKYSSADLMLAKVEADGSYTPVLNNPAGLHTGTYFGARSIYPTKDLKLSLPEPGQYIVRTKVRWVLNRREKYVLSAYTPFKIDLQKVAPIKNFLSKFFYTIGSKAQKKDMGNFCYYSSAYYARYLYIYLENENEAKNWIVNIKFSKLNNLTLDKRFKTDETSLKLEVPAGSAKIAVLKKIETKDKSEYSWSFQTQLV